MYFTLVFSTYVGLIQVTTESESLWYSVFMLVANLIYLSNLAIQSFKVLLKNLRKSPKLANLYLVLTFFQGNIDDIKQQQLQEEKSEAQMKQIDQMILHLTKV
jgi:hypothetical protein